MTTRKSQQDLLMLLKKKENAGESVTLDEILKYTKWKKSTFYTYWNKGRLNDFLNETESGVYIPSNISELTEDEFSRLLSQSTHRQELGHVCKSRLAKALLRKSRDNMLLAIELYNRPSLDNRLDSFVLCFCVAWEQLLKTMLIEKSGENSIFKSKSKKNKIRETISLRGCLDKLYQKDDLVRKNVELITHYRDRAVHLLMPEIQGQISRLFQSGIMNYIQEFEHFSRHKFLSSSHSGLLSLVGDLKDPDNAILRSRYGSQVGREISHIINNLTIESSKYDDVRFAIPINVRLVFAKNNEEGDIILSQANDGMEGLRNAIVVEKPVDRERTHPYRQKEMIPEINRRLNERYGKSDLEHALISRNKNEQPCVNEYDFQAIIHKLKWKNSNNRHHHMSRNPEYHYYSEDAVEEIVKKIMSDVSFISRCRDSHGNRNKKITR